MNIDSGVEVNPCDVLLTLENRINAECKRYTESLWEELSPATADKLRLADMEIRRREELVEQGRRSIEGERETQESMLRDFRSMMQAAGGAQGSGGVNTNGSGHRDRTRQDAGGDWRN